MVSRTDGLLFDIGQGFSALDAQAHRDRLDGYAVVDGLEVTTDGTDLTLDVAAGTATVGESGGTVDTVSGGATTVTLDVADSTNPRKDVVYIDDTGSVDVEPGDAEAAEPSGNTRFETYQPEPPRPSGEAVILAEVWVGAGTSQIVSGDIRDRRQPSDAVFGDVSLQTVETTGAATFGGSIELSPVSSTTATATGGSDPAASGTIAGVTTDQLNRVEVLHAVASDPAFNADYGVTLSWWPEWDDSDGEVDIGYQLVWQTDPGAGNDVDYDIEVFEQ